MQDDRIVVVEFGHVNDIFILLPVVVKSEVLAHE